MADKTPKVKKERFRWAKQLRQAYQLGHKGDPRLPWVMLAVFGGGFVRFLALGFLLKSSPRPRSCSAGGWSGPCTARSTGPRVRRCSP